MLPQMVNGHTLLLQVALMMVELHTSAVITAGTAGRMMLAIKTVMMLQLVP